MSAGDLFQDEEYSPRPTKKEKVEEKYTASEWAIISGGHTLEESQPPKRKLFDFGKY